MAKDPAQAHHRMDKNLPEDTHHTLAFQSCLQMGIARDNTLMTSLTRRSGIDKYKCICFPLLDSQLRIHQHLPIDLGL